MIRHESDQIVHKIEREYSIKFEKPPIWDAVRATMNIEPKDVFFTYGNTLYSPDTVIIPDDILAHEEVHMKQQHWNEANAAIWWGRYLREPEFRVEQELAAYAKQYAVICAGIKDRNRQAKYLQRLAWSMSGPLYGYAMTHNDAITRISKLAKTL